LIRNSAAESEKMTEAIACRFNSPLSPRMPAPKAERSFCFTHHHQETFLIHYRRKIQVRPMGKDPETRLFPLPYFRQADLIMISDFRMT